jgi:hypothetical protein
LNTNFEKLLLSSMRLSSAATLFTFGQLEIAVSGRQEGTRLGNQLDRIGTTVDSLSQCLMAEISPGKKAAVDSFAEITSKVLHQSLDGMGLFNPGQAFRIAADLAQKSSSVIAGWAGNVELPVEERPQLAVDVLAN